MADFHRLDADSDGVFLTKELVDPLTRVAFRPTNHVARCKTCGLVTLRETWEAVGGCPNGHSTIDRWDPKKAAQGDGQLGAPPVVAAPVPVAVAAPVAASAPASKTRPGWLIPFLAVLGVVALVAVGMLVARFMADDAPPPPAPVVAGPEAPTPSAARAGETTGELSDGDFRTDAGHFQDLYTFAADSSGRVLVFTLSTDDFYPDLVVTGPDGERVEAEQLDNQIDDSGDETVVTRRMRVTGLRGAGEYRVLVSTRQPLGTGAYTLAIKQESPVKTLTAGGRGLTGELGTYSQQADGFYTDRYRFAGIEGREHTITVTSTAFVPTAVVDGNARGQTERGADRVIYTFTPSRTGTYTLTVGSRERAKSGPYGLRLAVAPAPPKPETTADRPDRPSGTNTPSAPASVLRAGGSPVRDSLGSGETKTYSFRGRIGDRVTVNARAAGFSPSLVLIGPDGQRVAGPGDGDRARVRSTLATEGTYRVILSGSAAGTFSVELSQRAAPTSDDIPRLPGQTPRPSQPPATPAPAPAPTPTPAPTDTPPTDGEYTPAPIGDGTPTRPTDS